MKPTKSAKKAARLAMKHHHAHSSTLKKVNVPKPAVAQADKPAAASKPAADQQRQQQAKPAVVAAATASQPPLLLLRKSQPFGIKDTVRRTASTEKLRQLQSQPHCCSTKKPTVVAVKDARFDQMASTKKLRQLQSQPPLLLLRKSQPL